MFDKDFHEKEAQNGRKQFTNLTKNHDGLG